MVLQILTDNNVLLAVHPRPLIIVARGPKVRRFNVNRYDARRSATECAELIEPPLAALAQPLNYFESGDSSWRGVVRVVGVTAIVLGFSRIFELYTIFLQSSSRLHWPLWLLLPPSTASAITGLFLLIAGTRTVRAPSRSSISSGERSGARCSPMLSSGSFGSFGRCFSRCIERVWVSGRLTLLRPFFRLRREFCCCG